MKSEDINRILGIKESFELPERMMELLLDEEKKNIMFDSFIELGEALTSDWFTEYFQENHSNRDKMMQDFTPKEIAYLVNNLDSTHAESVLDVCAGTGGLTIKAIDNHPNYIECQELSKRAIPLLLFNMAIRNINATVIEQDVLSNEKTAVYKLTKSSRYSDIRIAKYVTNRPVDKVIMNPPYSVSCKNIKPDDVRFSEYCQPPTSKMDYTFVLHGLARLKDTGTLCAILPHGVLFRGAQEKEIRQRLIEKNILDTVIGLPDKLFINTSIPVCIIILKKSRQIKDILFIDASKDFIKEGKLNRMTEEHLEKIIRTYRDRRKEERYSDVVTPEKIKENDYNLNIPRYIDTYVPEPVPDLVETLNDLAEIETEIRKVSTQLFETMDTELTGFSTEEKEAIKKIIGGYRDGF